MFDLDYWVGAPQFCTQGQGLTCPPCSRPWRWSKCPKPSDTARYLGAQPASMVKLDLHSFIHLSFKTVYYSHSGSCIVQAFVTGLVPTSVVFSISKRKSVTQTNHLIPIKCCKINVMAPRGMKVSDPSQIGHQRRLPRVSSILAEDESVGKSWTGTGGRGGRNCHAKALRSEGTQQLYI